MKTPSPLSLLLPSLLHSLTAFDLVKMLKGLASTGRNIICTIHQPSYEVEGRRGNHFYYYVSFFARFFSLPFQVFSMFDRLLLLEEGKVAFNGPVEDVVGYFKECGYDVRSLSSLSLSTKKEKENKKILFLITILPPAVSYVS